MTKSSYCLVSAGSESTWGCFENDMNATLQLVSDKFKSFISQIFLA